MAKHNKMYKSLGMKRTWALSIGAATILGGLGTATVLTRYFGASSIATNAQINAFWETVENNSASFFHVSEFNNQEGDATFQFQESTFLNFIERNHIDEDFVITLNQKISYENSEGDTVTEEYVYNFDKNNLSELGTIGLYMHDEFSFKFKIKDGEWKEITSPFDRQNFDHPTDLRSPKLFSVTGVVENDAVYARINYPNELFAAIDVMVDKDNPTEAEMMTIGAMILDEPENKIFDQNTFSKITGVLDQAVMVDVRFKKATDNSNGYEFTQDNIDRFFVAGEEYVLTVRQTEGATQFWDSRLELHDNREYYKEFKFMADPTDWKFNWNTSHVIGEMHSAFAEAIPSTELDLLSGYFDEMTIDLDKLNEEIKKALMSRVVLASGIHEYNWITLDTSIELVGAVNGELNQGDWVRFKIIDNNGAFNAPEITMGETVRIPVQSGDKRTVQETGVEIWQLILDGFNDYAASRKGISRYFSGSLEDYLILEGNYNFGFSVSSFTSAENGRQETFTIQSIDGYIFEPGQHNSANTEITSGANELQITIDVDGLLEPIPSFDQWVGLLDVQSSYGGFEAGSIELLDQAITDINASLTGLNYSIEKVTGFNYSNLSLGSIVDIALVAEDGYTFTNFENGSPQFTRVDSYRVTHFDYDKNKTLINLVDGELIDLISTLVQDVGNWSGNYSGDMTFTIPDVLAGKNYTIEMHDGNHNWRRTLTGVSNDTIINFRITENKGYIFNDTAVTEQSVKVDSLISHDVNITTTWDTDLAWTFLSGAPNSRVDLTIDLDAIARFVFGDTVTITMNLTNGTLSADNDLPTFTVTPKDGYFLSTQSIYATVDLSDFVEAPKIQIGSISQSIWDTLVNSEFYTTYTVSGTTVLEYTLDNIRELEEMGIDSISVEHFDKNGETSDRVYNGQTIKIHVEPGRDYEFSNPDDASYTFVVSGLKYYYNSPTNLTSFIESQYRNSIIYNADNDANHRQDGSYKISVDQLLISEYIALAGIVTVQIEGLASYDSLSAGRNEVTFTIPNNNEHFFVDGGVETKTVTINITINEVPIKDEWKTAIDIDQTMYDALIDSIRNNISGVNGAGHIDYSGLMTSLEAINSNIDFTFLKNGQVVSSDLNDIDRLDVLRINMNVGEWFKLTNDTSTDAFPDGTGYFVTKYPELNNPITENFINEALDELYRDIDAMHVSGFPINGDMEYNESTIRAKILSYGGLSTMIEITNLEFIDADGFVVSNGALSNGFTIRVTFAALPGNNIVDSANDVIISTTLETQAITNDSKISITSIDFATEANKLYVNKVRINTSTVRFDVMYGGEILNPGDAFVLEIITGVFATIAFVPTGGDYIGFWTNFNLQLTSTNFTGDNSWGYEWDGTPSSTMEAFNMSTIAGHDDIYTVHLIMPTIYSEIANANEHNLIYDVTGTTTGEGYIDGTTLTAFNDLLAGRAILVFYRANADGSTNGFEEFDPNSFNEIKNGDQIRIMIESNPNHSIYSGRNADGTFAVSEEITATTVPVSSMPGDLPKPDVDTSGALPVIEGFEIVPYYTAGGVGYTFKGAGNEEFWKMFDIQVSGGTNKIFGNGEEVTVTIYYKSLGGIMYQSVATFNFDAIVSSSNTASAIAGPFEGETFMDSGGNRIPYTHALEEIINNMQQVGYEKNKVSSNITLTFNQSWSPQYGFFGPTGSKLEAFAEKALISYTYTSAELNKWRNFYVDMEIYTSLNVNEVEEEYRLTFGSDRSLKSDILLLGSVGTHTSQTHENVEKALDALWFAQEIVYDILAENHFDASAHHLTRESPYGDMAQMPASVPSFLKIGMPGEYNDIIENDDPFLSTLFTNDVSGTGTIFDGMNVGTFLSEFFSNYNSWFTSNDLRNMRISNEINGQAIIGNRDSADPGAMADYLENHSFYLTKEIELIFGLMFGWDGVSENSKSSAFQPYYIDNVTTSSDWSTTYINHINSENWKLSSMHRGMSVPLYLSKAQYNALGTDVFEGWRYMTNGPFGSTLQNDETINSGSYGKAIIEYMENIDTDNIASETTFENKVYTMYDELLGFEVGQLFGNPLYFISPGTTPGNATNSFPNIEDGYYGGLMSTQFNGTNPRNHPIRSEADITQWVNDLISNNTFYFNQVELKQLQLDENRTSTTFAESPQVLSNTSVVDSYTDIVTDIYKRK